MFKLKEKESRSNPNVVRMLDMEPGQFGVVVGGSTSCLGHLVLRTLSCPKFEAMDLSDPKPDSCWLSPHGTTLVELLPPGTEVTLVQGEL